MNILPELLILSFPTKTGAKKFLRELAPLQDEHLIRLEDAAIAVKDGKGRVFGTVKADLAAHGLVSGSLWGTLTGALFFEPFLGLLMGGLVGMLTGTVIGQSDEGINPALVQRTAKKALEPNWSALFLLVSKITPDKVTQRMAEHQATIVSTSLPIHKEKQLRDAWRMVREDGPLALQNTQPTRMRADDTRLLPAAISK